MFGGAFGILFLTFGLATSQCPSGAFEWQSTCLIFKTTSDGFADAEITCQGIGGHLASIHDGFSNAIIGRKWNLKQLVLSFFGSGSCPAFQLNLDFDFFCKRTVNVNFDFGSENFD